MGPLLENPGLVQARHCADGEIKAREGDLHCKFMAQMGLEFESLDCYPSALCNTGPCCSLSETLSGRAIEGRGCFQLREVSMD